MNFENIFTNHNNKSISKWHHYFDIYDRHLNHLIGKEFTLLEIGVSKGGSLQCWKKYFGNKVKIVGIDIDINTYYCEPQINVHIGNQSDIQFLKLLLNKIDQPTVIIDDGSHKQSDIISTFDYLFPKLLNLGIYLIEDCHTSYWPRFEGGLHSHLNFVEIMSRNVHDVNHKWYNLPRIPKLKNLKSICFYDSIIVCEKEEPKTRLMIDNEQGNIIIKEKV